MSTNSEDIKRLVREKYGEKAKGASQLAAPSPADSGYHACFGPECCDASNEDQRQPEGTSQSTARGVIQLTEVSPAASDSPTCCDPGCCSPADSDRALKIYTEGQIAGLPAETVAASAGCGNPTALASLRRGERVLDLGSGGGIDCFLAAQQVGEEGHVTGWT